MKKVLVTQKGSHFLKPGTYADVIETVYDSESGRYFLLVEVPYRNVRMEQHLIARDFMPVDGEIPQELC